MTIATEMKEYLSHKDEYTFLFNRVYVAVLHNNDIAVQTTLLGDWDKRDTLGKKEIVDMLIKDGILEWPIMQY